jgi:endonuclease YncB( thermonuclease family)
MASCALVFVGVFAAGLALPALPALSDLRALPGPILSVPGRPILEAITVVDGDTVRLSGGEKIRISNIDTPETPPRSSCPEEARLAQAATTNLRSMVAGARDVRFVPDGDRERDVYGRLLGRVVINGVDVGEAQIAAGLAQRWQGHRAWWCG